MKQPSDCRLHHRSASKSARSVCSVAGLRATCRHEKLRNIKGVDHLSQSSLRPEWGRWEILFLQHTTCYHHLPFNVGQLFKDPTTALSTGARLSVATACKATKT